MKSPDQTRLSKQLLQRFLRYTRIDTMSNPVAADRPSSPGQLELAAMLKNEFKALGISDVSLVDNRFLLARVPARGCANRYCIGFMAHLDTSSDVTGKGVNPQVHENYNGREIVLAENIRLDPGEFPDLKRFTGDTIITSDGSTLLGADDKAGIAEIMTALEYIKHNQDLRHPRLEILFTTDEETGRGMDEFPLDSVRASFCYTFDGGDDGIIEAENFEAYKVTVRLQGRSFHLGKAHGRLINSIQMLNSFLCLLPAMERPETTEKKQGYYCPINLTGNIETTEVQFLIRDFKEEECLRRIEVLRQIAIAVEKSYPGSGVHVSWIKQYANMQRFLKPGDPGLKLLEKAISMTGIQPVYTSIRGGTDGARLSELGIPTPNVFTGGFNFHSRFEWIPLSAMVRAARVIVNLTGLWAELK